MTASKKISRWFSDTGVMVNRSMTHMFRSIDTIITVIAMSVMMMLLFIYVFGGAIATGAYSGSYIDYILPGILLMAVGSGVSYASVRMNNDVTEGIFERFHSMPIAKSSVLWGHVISSTISCFISLIVIVLLALLMGFRSSASILEWFEATGIILLFTLATTWMAILSGLLAKTAEGAGVFSYPLMFLPFISSAFVPTATMPTPVRVFAENQPVTSIVESVRGLLLGQPVSNDIWMALAWHVGLLVLMYVLAIRAYKRKMR